MIENIDIICKRYRMEDVALIYKIKRLLSLNMFQFIYYNFMCKNVYRDKGKFILPHWGTCIDLDKTARIILHGSLHLNENKYPHSHAECYLRLRDRSVLTIAGPIYVYYNGTIEVHKNARLSIGECTIQSGAVIICAYKMLIGNGCLFSRMCYISDSDHHKVTNPQGEVTNRPRETIIGDNVWLGIKATIMKGAKVKNGCVIGANSVAGGHIKEHMFLMCEPARSFSEIYWSTDRFGEDND